MLRTEYHRCAVNKCIGEVSVVSTCGHWLCTNHLIESAAPYLTSKTDADQCPVFHCLNCGKKTKVLDNEKYQYGMFKTAPNSNGNTDSSDPDSDVRNSTNQSSHRVDDEPEEEDEFDMQEEDQRQTSDETSENNSNSGSESTQEENQNSEMMTEEDEEMENSQSESGSAGEQSSEGSSSSSEEPSSSDDES